MCHNYSSVTDLKRICEYWKLKNWLVKHICDT